MNSNSIEGHISLCPERYKCLDDFMQCAFGYSPFQYSATLTTTIQSHTNPITELVQVDFTQNSEIIAKTTILATHPGQEIINLETTTYRNPNGTIDCKAMYHACLEYALCLN